MANETGFSWATTLEKRAADRLSIEPPSWFHYSRMASRNILVAQVDIEVIRDPSSQAVEVYIDEKRISTGHNSRK